MNKTLSEIASWLAALDQDECELIIKLKAFGQIMWSKAKKYNFGSNIERVGYFGIAMWSPEKMTELSTVSFDDAHNACNELYSLMSRGSYFHGLDEDYVALLQRIVNLRQYIPGMKCKLFGDPIYDDGKVVPGPSGVGSKSGVKSYLDVATGSVKPEERVYVIDFTPREDMLLLKSGTSQCSMHVGSDFVLLKMLKSIVGAEVSERYYGDASETYKRIDTLDPDVKSTPWTQVFYSYQKCGYDVLYKCDGVKILYRVVEVSGAKSVLLYCATVVCGYVDEQMKLRFPIAFIKNQLIRLEGVVDDMGIRHFNNEAVALDTERQPHLVLEYNIQTEEVYFNSGIMSGVLGVGNTFSLLSVLQPLAESTLAKDYQCSTKEAYIQMFENHWFSPVVWNDDIEYYKNYGFQILWSNDVRFILGMKVRGTDGYSVFVLVLESHDGKLSNKLFWYPLSFIVDTLSKLDGSGRYDEQMYESYIIKLDSNDSGGRILELSDRYRKIIIPVDRDFGYDEFLRRVTNRNAVVTMNCTAIESTDKCISGEYGLNSSNRMTDWNDLSSCFMEDKFSFVYRGSEGKAMCRVVNDLIGCFVQIYCAFVRGDEIINHTMLCFPMTALELMLGKDD